MADKPKIPYVYDAEAKRYRSTDTGRFVSASTFSQWRENVIGSQSQAAQNITRRLMEGQVNLDRWEREMRQIIKQTHGMLYAAGKGGYQNMTQADWGRVGQEVRTQYQYLGRFRQELAAGRLTAGQAVTRAGMYPGSANQAWEKGLAAQMFNPMLLPAYPGDGTTQCRTNCRCHWDIREDEMSWRAYWRLGAAEHCPDCVKREAIWSPYIISKATSNAY